MNKERTIDGILFEAIHHAAKRATGLSAQEAGMYERVREDLERHGGYEAAHEQDVERDRERETTATVRGNPPPSERRPQSSSGSRPASWPGAWTRSGRRTRRRARTCPPATSPSPRWYRRPGGVLQQQHNGFVPTAVTVRLLDLYLAVRREYDDQVRLLDSKAGISDERRPDMRERFHEDRLQAASETLAEAAPYEWGRTSLVVG